MNIVFPTPKDVRKAYCKGLPILSDEGAYKIAYDYSEDFVLLELRKGLNTRGDEWLILIEQVGLINAKHYLFEGKEFYIVEKLKIYNYVDHKDLLPTEVEMLVTSYDINEILEVIREFFPTWSEALHKFSQVFPQFRLDVKLANLGFRTTGEPILFDIVNI